MKTIIRISVILTVAFLLLSNTALAVSDYIIGSYDAGPAGGGPTNLDPVLQGWLSEEVNTGAAVPADQNVFYLKPDGSTGYNAMQINDQQGNTPTDNPRYSQSLDNAELKAMYDFGWEYEFRARPISGNTFTAWGVGPGSDPGWGFADRRRVGFQISRLASDNSAVIAPLSGTSVNLGPNSADSYHLIRAVGVPQSTSYSIYMDGDLKQTTTISNAGNAPSDNTFFLESGSSEGVGRAGNWNMLGLKVPAPSTLTLEVNTINGQVKLINNSLDAVSFNGYFLGSEGGQLKTNTWGSLEASGLDGNGIPNDGIGWERFDSSNSNFMGEGFLSGTSTVAAGSFLNLGTIFNPSIAGSGVDGDLTFALTDGLGRVVRSELFSTIDYVTTAGLAGDFDGDGDVDGRDFLNWQRNPSVGNLADWQGNYGVNLITANAQAIPEPNSVLILSVGTVLALAFNRKQFHFGAFGMRMLQAVSAMLFAAILTTTTSASTVDRDYTLGDDSFETSNAGATVGSSTYDSAGTGGQGDLQDLNAAGGPIYRAVTNRPGAGAGDLGIEFDGMNDVLYTPINMNRPSDMWDSAVFFPGPAPKIFPKNYEGINSNGIELWAKPITTNARQDLIFDSIEHGIYITAQNNWAMWHSGVAVDSGVTVASTVDPNGWVHVMKLSGFSTPTTGTNSSRGVLLVNGVAIAANAGAYELSTAPLSIGGSVSLDTMGQVQSITNPYKGILDDVEMFLWGDNSAQLGADGVLGGTNTAGALNADGQNWGTLNLPVDNEWIARKLTSLNITDPADVDLSGGAATIADRNLFLTHWRKQRLVNGVQVGDWVSRQNGDLNYDGIVNLADAFILHESLQGAGLGGLNFALLGTTVPEPSTMAFATLGILAATLQRKKGAR